ncbi:MAG: alcohol dehydrogenase catalytic domain-containing protein [Polyangiales bacterium]
MKAVWLEGERLSMREVEEPVPGPGEALVRVAMAGICNTDLELAKGYMGFTGVPGHELCGVVEQCDNPSWIGRRVCGEINLGCGHCPLCARDLARHCPQRTVMGILGKQGCFADRITLPIANLHCIPDSLPDELACFIEPTAAAFEVLEQLTVMSSDRVVVLGDGKLGLLVAQVLATTGCDLSVAGRHARKLALASKLGAVTCASADLPRKAFDVVVEATGSRDGLRRAVELARPRGTIVLKSTFHGELTVDAAPIVIDELRVIGSRCGPFPLAVAALEAGAIDPSQMVDAILPLSSALSAFERAAEPGALKILLDVRA